ncbi:ATP-binding protein [Parenemella sanctibonifatiensis]|uniref:Histidine kinase n=1 Tax=Parenemella sanctibonifatiensis TaxID=2016505 RepID=A0A255EAI1_9ACTN|nr:ATP-binding protein [Parenemella sanctibonifatiensis]OYN87931.1 histidine kinase [Parenemella sanctibonifatiensis]
MTDLARTPAALPQRPERPPIRPWVAGVNAALSRRTGIPVGILRAFFVLITMLNGVGSLVYVGLWIWLPAEERRPRRHGRSRGKRGRHGTWRWIALAILAAMSLGIILDGVTESLPWLAALLGAAGILLVWIQSRPDSGQVDHPAWLAPLLSRSREWVIVRTVVGLGLILWAIGIVFAEEAEFVPQAIAMGTMLFGGLGLVLAPWLYRARQAVTTSREEEVRAKAHAEMAAHLHDSVLQTLALIQKRSDDPAAVQTLARRQERELRAWLYPRGDSADGGAGIGLRTGLTEACARVEDKYDIPVELVVVGDAELESSAIIDAAAEAATNAAKHSGAAKIDVYAEVADQIEVFVRDRGAGFDPDQVPEDRHGIRDSVVGRMERHGGSVRIRTAPGQGTEVQLQLPLPSAGGSEGVRR